MGRLLTAIAVLAAPCALQAVELAPGHDAAIGLEAGYVDMSGYPAWSGYGYGKLRYLEDGLVFSRAYLDYQGRVSDTLDAHVVLEAYDDDLGLAVDYTEAYLEWRPVPRSPTRYRLKLGTYYPRISLENSAAGWSSPYTLNSSAINTWVAEELRNTGAELTISRRFASSQRLSASVSAFVANDPAGSLIAWKGWSVHDRQSRPSDDLPLPPIPQLEPGGEFGHQDHYAEPFIEIDGRTGYAVNVEWQMGNQLRLSYMRYNNEADPEAFERLQYGWYTEFDHVGMQVMLPGDIGLFAQWLDGVTVMGPMRQNAWYPVDVEYAATYLMLTRRFDKHRVAVRYDDFEVTDVDEMPLDDNGEDGHAWTLNYQYALNNSLTLAVESLNIRSTRGAWVYQGVDSTATERQLQVLLRVSF